MMLHELLIALNGYPGSIFVLTENKQFQVLKGLPFLHESEEVLLNEILKLATHYYHLQLFIKANGACPKQDAERRGMYLSALCDGLDKVLGEYRLALIILEKEILADPHLAVTHVQASLEEYQALFPVLHNVINHISQQKVHGCHILEVLYNASNNGMPKLKQSLLRILHMCHGVFYKQLCGWMLYGMLLDQYKEFFIQWQIDSGTASVPSGLDEEDLGISASEMQQILRAFDSGVKLPSQRQFMLAAELLPAYIPIRVAEKILFVGESVQMFESEKKIMTFKQRGSILKEQEDRFAKEIHNLSHDLEFDIMKFESVIDKIRIYVSEQLWRLIVEQSDLIQGLRTMKDFFLLGRGELFLAFIDKSKHLLKNPPTSTTQHDVNMAFQHAARDVLITDDDLLQSFSFTIPSSTEKTGSKSKSTTDDSSSNVSSSTTVETGWQAINLGYSVQQPLHILFTPPVIDRYNTLFRFLLYIKHIQLELQHCWAYQMSQKNSRSYNKNKWWLRNHMAFVIDNLQYYLQVDVIESQFSILVDKIEGTKDFENVRYAHENFLTSLLGQTFLLMKPIANCLHGILKLCNEFCTVARQSEDMVTEREETLLANIANSFKRQSNLLFMILSNVRVHQTSPHLAQLLLRVDFNKYFTNCGGQLGSIEPSTSAS